MELAFEWLLCLTVLTLIALFRKREIKYDGDYVVKQEINPWDAENILLEYLLENPNFIKKLIGKINEYQLNISGEIKNKEQRR